MREKRPFTSAGVSYQADGVGAILTGRAGSLVEGLKVQTVAAPGTAGTVQVTNGALVFQVGANAGQQVRLSIGNMTAGTMGTGLDATFGGTNQFANLAEISLLDADKAADSLAVPRWHPVGRGRPAVLRRQAGGRPDRGRDLGTRMQTNVLDAACRCDILN